MPDVPLAVESASFLTDDKNTLDLEPPAHPAVYDGSKYEEKITR